MRHNDPSRHNLLDALKNSLHGLNNLRLVPHNDPHVLRLKQHLREQIAKLEGEEAPGLTAA
jgi:hypothetical protein